MSFLLLFLFGVVWQFWGRFLNLVRNRVFNSFRIWSTTQLNTLQTPQPHTESRYGARNRFQEPNLEFSSPSTWPVRQPYAYSDICIYCTFLLCMGLCMGIFTPNILSKRNGKRLEFSFDLAKAIISESIVA
jgi:hypothetical protein